jgi:AraC-type DNA-binding domain-containing proteins
MTEAFDITRNKQVFADKQRVYFHIDNCENNYPAHWHTDIEIIMPIENSYKVYIDQQTYELNPKDIMIIPSGEVHEIIAPVSGKCMVTLIDNYLFGYLYGTHTMKNLIYSCNVIRADQKTVCHQQVVSILEKIEKEYDQHTPLYEAYIYSLLLEFVVLYGRNFLKQDELQLTMNPMQQQVSSEEIYNICNYINAHCMDALSLDKIAAIAGFSKYHFSRVFHDSVGLSFCDYLMKRRIIYAESLLCDPRMAIIEVAMQSGFQSVSSFNRNFRKIKNCSPKEYRNMYQAEVQIEMCMN